MKNAKTKSRRPQQRVVRALSGRRRVLARRIYRCLSACATLEAAAQCVLQRRAATGEDDAESMKLLEKCREKSRKARETADVTMHKLGMGYWQIYGDTPP